MLLALAAVLALCGCRREEISVYNIPKEIPAAPAIASAPDMGGGSAGAEGPAGISWTSLPAGWQQRPAEQMRVASFAVVGQDGSEGDVAVIPLPGIAGKEAEVVNLWRGQVKLPPLDDAEINRSAQKIEIASKEGLLFEEAGTEPVIDNKYPARILAGIINDGNTSWFFKMTGPDALVREQKPSFLNFLKTVSLTAGAGPQFAANGNGMSLGPGHGQMFSTNDKEVPTTDTDSSLPTWQPPSNWQTMRPMPPLVAKFSISGADGAHADVNIGPSGGGTLMNVNRWRGQLGLQPVDDSNLNSQTTPLDANGAKALVVDFSGTNQRTQQPARLVGAIVPQGDQTWYYKLMGDDSVVGREKEAFLKFVQTVRYPNAP